MKLIHEGYVSDYYGDGRASDPTRRDCYNYAVGDGALHDSFIASSGGMFFETIGTILLFVVCCRAQYREGVEHGEQGWVDVD